MKNTVARKLAPAVLAAVSALASLALLAQLSATTPPPKPIDLDVLRVNGYQLSGQAMLAARSDDRHAHGELRRWVMQPLNATEPALTLATTAVHSRLDTDFELTRLSRHPGLPAIEDAQAVQLTAAGRPTQVVVGRSGQDAMLRTCLLPDGSTGVSLDELRSAGDRQREGGLIAVLQRFAGLKSNPRWECLLVSISAPDGEDSQQRLSSAWEQAYPALAEKMAASEAKTSHPR